LKKKCFLSLIARLIDKNEISIVLRFQTPRAHRSARFRRARGFFFVTQHPRTPSLVSGAAETMAGAVAVAVEGEALLGGGEGRAEGRDRDRVRVGARVAAALAALALVALAVGVDVSGGASGSARAAGLWPTLGAAAGEGGDAAGAKTPIPHVSRKEGGPLPDVDPLVTFNTPRCMKTRAALARTTNHDGDVVVIPELKAVYVDIVKAASESIRSALEERFHASWTQDYGQFAHPVLGRPQRSTTSYLTKDVLGKLHVLHVRARPHDAVPVVVRAGDVPRAVHAVRRARRGRDVHAHDPGDHRVFAGPLDALLPRRRAGRDARG
jgi:hypothetical protein